MRQKFEDLNESTETETETDNSLEMSGVINDDIDVSFDNFNNSFNSSIESNDSNPCINVTKEIETNKAFRTSTPIKNNNNNNPNVYTPPVKKGNSWSFTVRELGMGEFKKPVSPEQLELKQTEKAPDLDVYTPPIFTKGGTSFRVRPFNKLLDTLKEQGQPYSFDTEEDLNKENTENTASI